jgi:hypothetical protein
LLLALALLPAELLDERLFALDERCSLGVQRLELLSGVLLPFA